MEPQAQSVYKGENVVLGFWAYGLGLVFNSRVLEVGFQELGLGV